MALKPLFPLLGNGKCLYHLVHVDDLTNAMLVAATHPKAVGEAFICGAEESIGIADIAAIVAGYFGKKVRWCVFRLDRFIFLVICVR